MFRVDSVFIICVQSRLCIHNLFSESTLYSQSHYMITWNVLWFSLIWLCSSILLLHCLPQRLHLNFSLFSCTCFPCLYVHVATVILGNYGIYLWMVCFSMLCHIVVSELLPTSVAFCSVRVYNFFTIEVVSSYFFQLCFEVLNYIFQFPYYFFPVLIAFHLFGFYSLGRTFILTFLTRGRF